MFETAIEFIVDCLLEVWTFMRCHWLLSLACFIFLAAVLACFVW